MATVAIETNESVSQETSPWADIIYDILITAGVRQMSYVPDAGHARLIELIRATSDITSNVLTTEEEGIAIAAGAWAGGQRSVLLMQSSGVGNCVNMLSLIASCRMPRSDERRGGRECVRSCGSRCRPDNNRKKRMKKY